MGEITRRNTAGAAGQGPSSHLVSVVIPCYNQAAFVAEAIESVLRQTHKTFEVVVVDDGSPDDTSEVAARYEGVRCVRQENRGLAEARNRGLRESTGEFLVFLDADDRLLPGALAAGVASLTGRPQCGFVYGHVSLIDGDGASLPPPVQHDVERDHYLALLRNNYIWTPGVVMYRRAVVEAARGFNPIAHASADFELNARIARQHPIHCHGEVVLEYRLHSANMTRNYSLLLRDGVTVRRLHRRYLPGDAAHRKALDEGIAVVRAGYGRKLAEQVRSQIAARELRRAAGGFVTLLRYHPLAAAGLARRVLRSAASGFKARPEPPPGGR